MYRFDRHCTDLGAENGAESGKRPEILGTLRPTCDEFQECMIFQAAILITPCNVGYFRRLILPNFRTEICTIAGFGKMVSITAIPMLPSIFIITMYVSLYARCSYSMHTPKSILPHHKSDTHRSQAVLFPRLLPARMTVPNSQRRSNK